MKREDIERARKLLKIADIIEKYQYYLIRKSIGSFYIGIISVVAIGLFTYPLLLEILGESRAVLAGILTGLITAIIFILWFVSAFTSPKIFLEKEKKRKKFALSVNLLWLSLFSVYGIIGIVDIFMPLPEFIYPFYLSLMIGIGNIGNYFFSRKTKDYPGKIEKEYLYLGLVAILPAFIIPFVPQVEYQWSLDFIAIWFGMFIFGIYVIITAPRVFEEGHFDGNRGHQETSEVDEEG